MTDAMTLPGSIPGLLRRGSPCLLADGRSITIHGVRPHGAWGATGGPTFLDGELDGAELEGLSLDLTDATGRAHAAWWAMPQWTPDVGAAFRDASMVGYHFARALLTRAASGSDLREDEIEILRGICLHVAGLNQ